MLMRFGNSGSFHVGILPRLSPLPFAGFPLGFVASFHLVFVLSLNQYNNLLAWPHCHTVVPCAFMYGVHCGGRSTPRLAMPQYDEVLAEFQLDTIKIASRYGTCKQHNTLTVASNPVQRGLSYTWLLAAIELALQHLDICVMRVRRGR